MNIETSYKDTCGISIKIGDNLTIIATNMYSGHVNEVNGEPYLETLFFNKPLSDHLTALDFEECYIENVVPDDNENSFFI